MAYPSQQGGYPYPPAQAGFPNAGFGTSPGQAPGYPPTQTPSSGMPYPPLPGSTTSYPPSTNFTGGAYLPQPGAGSYSPQPPAGFGPSPPPPGQGLPYQAQPGQNSPYPPQPGMNSPYPPQTGNSPPYLPGAGTSSPYPPGAGTSSPYPPSAGTSSPYPPGRGTNLPYSPGTGTSSPYPPGPGTNSPYPQLEMNSPYPPQTGRSSPYPPGAGTSAPYPPNPGTSSPYPTRAGTNLPYAPGTGTGAPYAPGTGTGAPYEPGSGTGAPCAPGTGTGAPYAPGTGTGAPYAPGTATNSPYPLGAGTNTPTFPNQQTSSVHQNYSTPESRLGKSSSYQGSLWPYQERPTLRPSAMIDPSMEASTLRKAIKGFGTDEAAIIQVLTKRTDQQRQTIRQAYQQSYGKDLRQKLQGEVRGDFGDVIDALMMPIPEFLAKDLHEAMDGIGTKEDSLVQILCANDNNTLRAIKEAYQRLYGKRLEKDLQGDTTGSFERLLVAIATGARDEAGTIAAQPSELAQILYASGAQRLGTDESEFIRILSVYSYPTLRQVFHEYEKISGGKSFEAAIRSELSGDFETGMLAIYACIQNRAAYFAERLRDAMKGFGTRDKALIRIVVSRSEIDLGNVKDEYLSAYGKRLEDTISSETSGDFQKVLLALMQE